MSRLDKERVFAPLHVFAVISLTGSLSFFAFAFLRGSAAFDWLCMRNTGQLRFVDYFQHVLYSAYPKQLYAIATGPWGCFPPLAYVLYHFLYKLTAITGVNPASVNDLLNTDYGLTVFVLYSVLSAFGLMLAIDLWNDKRSGKLLFLCLLLSAPFFAGGLERGNSVLLVVILLLIALRWRGSGSAVKREAAMILIAVCAGLKIYPAVFGLLYLKEHRFKEALRLVAYGALFFFGPFAFFGGVDGIKLWLFNVMDTMGMDCTGRIEFIKGAVCSLSYIISGKTNTYLASVMTNLFFVLMLFLSFISGSKYRTVFFLSAIMALFPGNMHRYALMLLAIPLVMLLMEKGDERIRDPFVWIEIVGFGCLFSIPTVWGLLTGFRLRFALSDYITYVEFWLYVVAYLLVLVFCVHEFAAVFKKKEYNQDLKRRHFPGKAGSAQDGEAERG